MMLFSAGWASSWYLGSAGRSSAFSCPSCWGLSKFSSITAYMRDVLHWLPISERIQYRITAMVSHCVLGYTPLTSATSAAQCRFWPHVGCCVLLRGVSFWSLVPVWLLCSEGPFWLWVHQHGMTSPLSCVPC